MPDAATRVDELAARCVRETFAANPHSARYAGAHEYDGILGDAGEAAVRRRLSDLDSLLVALDGVGRDGALGDEAAADLATCRLLARSERFRLGDLRDPWTDPRFPLAAADVSTYVQRPYAPVAERSEKLCAHLEQLPDHLDAGARMLDDEISMGPRQIALDEVRGHASFYRDDVRDELGALDDPALRARLDAAIETAATACERFAARVEELHGRDDFVLGAERLCAMLEAQEGVRETAPALRLKADAELARLTAWAGEVAGELGGDVPGAFEQMESQHPAADALISTASEMLSRLRQFWIDSGVVSIDADARCVVRPSPAFMSWVTAAQDSPGPLGPPGLPHFYYVTPVQPGWTDEQIEQWLRHLNFASLENISVHEVYPGHFVHAVCGERQRSVVRRAFWFSGFGEGWAHYAEQLAVERGLAEGKPLLELAVVQDALLRICRFRATVGMHAEGMSLEEATQLFVDHAHLPRLPAEREALRATYDPMYLVYSYGKLEILRWREQLSASPGFDLRRFHDRLLGSGYPPLEVVREYVHAPAA
jgi:uncharacterized protein DUF885